MSRPYDYGIVGESTGMPQTIQTDDAPAAVGAYSQATVDDDLVFTAGQIALTPEGDDLTDRPPAEQAEQCLNNLKAVLEAAGSGFDDVLKTTVYLDDIEDYEAVNEAYGSFFTSDPPARSAVSVADLPKGAAVEIEAVASIAR